MQETARDDSNHSRVHRLIRPVFGVIRASGVRPADILRSGAADAGSVLPLGQHHNP
jgi:hypothetical protein